jgi:hypothetical protein
VLRPPVGGNPQPQAQPIKAPPFPIPAPVGNAPQTVPASVNPEAPPTFCGTVRILVFSETIATGPGVVRLDEKRRQMIESALRRQSGVASILYEAPYFDVAYTGPYSGLDKLQDAVASTGTSNEIVSPLKVRVRPFNDPEAALKSLRGVSGVSLVIRTASECDCYAGLEVDLDALARLGEVVSHERIEVRFKGTVDLEAARSDLESMKGVLKVDMGADETRLLCRKNRVLKCTVRSVLSKHGAAKLP